MVSNRRRLDDDDFARWWQETGEYELCHWLYWKWDPINISHAFPFSAGEYDRYAAQFFSALRDGASVDAIAEMFGAIPAERMGLGRGLAQHRQALAALTLDWFENSQARWKEFGPLRR